MVSILAIIASILAIAGLAWGARRLLGAPLCPICLGVGGTWMWLLAAREFGYAVDTAMLAVLLGGSVAGIAYQLEKRLPPGRSALLWKTLFIPVGFVAAWGLATQAWPWFLAASLALLPLAAFFLLAPAAPRPETESAKVEELTRKMRDCC